MLAFFLALIFLLDGVASAPFDFDAENVDVPSKGSDEGKVPGVLNFLRKYGYLPSNGNDSASETIYTESKLSEAIRHMQRFGGLKETGRLDERTLELLTRPRCGVADVASANFALGSNGWNKRHLTYRLENWSPNLRPQDVRLDLEKAFNVWARHSRLLFTNHERSSDEEVDIAISFGRGYHGDTFSFDGQGGVLAHAFFPQNTPGLSGDIHFDMDENWFRRDETGQEDKEYDKHGHRISFLDVALHELGHSLGLAHSAVETSVMFPYYQARSKTGEPELGQDDILALYHLYVRRQIPDQNPDPRPTTTTTTPKTTPGTRATVPTPSSTTIKPFSREKTNKSADAEPELCQGKYDTIAFIRNELFVFQGKYMWRYRDRGEASGGSYPAESSRLFPLLKDLERVDSAFEYKSDMVFTSGKSYWKYDGRRGSGPFPLTDFGLPSDLDKVDAALVWGKNDKLYFFRESQYWRFDPEGSSQKKKYPQSIRDGWKGVPNHLSAALAFRDGKTYFFKGSQFWVLDDNSVRTEESIPKPTMSYWFGCK